MCTFLFPAVIHKKLHVFKKKWWNWKRQLLEKKFKECVCKEWTTAGKCLACRLINFTSLWKLHVWTAPGVTHWNVFKILQWMDFVSVCVCVCFSHSISAWSRYKVSYRTTFISDFTRFHATASFLRRLELQHGFGLPVPQLESVCGGVRAAVRLCSGSAHFYAWEPPLLPGGKRQTQYTVMPAAPFSLPNGGDNDFYRYQRI